METINKIVTAVLYEGYLLWPYRRSALKNRQRWTFGGVFPRAYSEASANGDPWLMQTECLVVGRAPRTAVTVRFLHVVERQVGRHHASGLLEFVDELQVGDQRYLTWDEATERTIVLDDLDLTALSTPRRCPITITADSAREDLLGPDGRPAGALVRSWRQLQGEIAVQATAVGEWNDQPVFRLHVAISNATPWAGYDRSWALKQTLVSTHTILTVTDGEFVSLTDPPLPLHALAEGCTNVKTWPVLAGATGDRQTMLSSPIILYDYPQVAPESPGDLFDGAEIDQLLVLNILTLTDAEKAEIRATDPRGREILARTEALTADDFMQLHGAIREFQAGNGRADPALEFPTWYEELEQPAPSSVLVNQVAVRPGSKVRLNPQPGGDVFDLALAGQVALVEAIEQDYNGRIHLAVALENDPGQDLGPRRPGRRFYFAPEEVEPLES